MTTANRTTMTTTSDPGLDATRALSNKPNYFDCSYVMNSMSSDLERSKCTFILCCNHVGVHMAPNARQRGEQERGEANCCNRAHLAAGLPLAAAVLT
jgi:hypothetical protein